MEDTSCFSPVPPSAEVAGTYAASLDGGEPKLVLRNNFSAVYAPPGYLLFVRDNTLMAERFDASKLHVIGDAIPLAENTAVDETTGRAIFSVSESGILAYQRGATASGGNVLLWFDRNGKEIGQTGGPGYYPTTSISPDGAAAHSRRQLVGAAEKIAMRLAAGTKLGPYGLSRRLKMCPCRSLRRR